VAFVGHSLARDLQNFALNGDASPSNFGLSDCQTRCYAVGSWKVQDLKGAFSFLEDFCPQAVVLIIGDNDLNRGVEAEKVAAHIIAMASMIKLRFRVDKVIAGQIMPRFWQPHHRYFLENYNSLAYDVNESLAAGIPSVEGLTFWRHNFLAQTPADPSFLRSKRLFVSDGGHLAPNGQCMFYRSWGRAVRQCRLVA
jgi:hypothetical protein